MTALTILKVPLDERSRRALDRYAASIAVRTEERDKLICQAYADGAGMREIARAVRMTHPGVRNILIRRGAYDPNRADTSD